MLRFKVDATNTSAHFSIEANDATYRRFGAVADGGRLYVQYNDGGGYRAPIDLLSNLELNTWYVLRIVVDDVRGFTTTFTYSGTFMTRKSDALGNTWAASTYWTHEVNDETS